MTFWILSSSALLLVLTGLRFLLRGRISPVLQYALWALALLRLLIPGTAFKTSVSAQNLVNRNQLVRDAEILRDFDHVSYSDDGTLTGYINGYIDPCPVVISRNATPEEYLRLRNTLDWRDVLRPVWYAGIAAVGAAFLFSNLSFARRLRRSRREVDISASVLPVYVCEGLKTPCLFGVFRPAIYITPEVEADAVKLRHVLAHETTHYRHGDNLWAVPRGIALALHWFNPLVWWASSLSRRDAETACDAGAIRRLGEEERADYGRTLIGLTVKKAGRFDMLCCATTMTGSGKILKERITMIAKNPKTKIAALAVLIAAVAVAAVCLFTGAKAEQEPVSETPNASILRGTVLDIDLRDNGYGYLVDIEWSGGRFLKDDQVWVRAAGGLEPSPEPMVGDKVEVLFGETLDEVLAYDTQPPLLGAKSVRVVEQWISGYYSHGMSFSGLMPGEEKVFERTIELDGTKPVYFQISWARAGLDVEAGLRDTAGREFGSLQGGGTGEGLFSGFPAGTYTFFVRNSESNLDQEASSNAQLAVGGLAAFGDYYPTEYEVAQTPQPTVIPLLPDAETSTRVIASADLDHDGAEEQIVLTHQRDGETGQLYRAALSVEGEGWTWTGYELSTSHAGWGKYFLCTLDGEEYLLYYNPAMSTGIGSYIYELFDLSGGLKHVARSGGVEFMIAGPGMLDLPAQEMADFAGEINALLEQSTLLVSVDGEVALGPADTAPYYEDYAMLLNDGRVVYPENATLREKIEIWESFLRARWASENNESEPTPEPAGAQVNAPIPTAMPTSAPASPSGSGNTAAPVAAPMPPADPGPDVPNAPTADTGVPAADTISGIQRDIEPHGR